jgi:hypothetical protein
MAVLTSRDAEVRLDGIGIAKARDISLQLSSETPEDTALGDTTRSYVYGLRAYSGSMTLLYDRSSPVSQLLQQQITADDTIRDLELILLDRNIRGPVLFQNTGISTSVGDVVSCQVSVVFNAISGTV